MYELEMVSEERVVAQWPLVADPWELNHQCLF